MSVLIKGMEMPQSCANCPIRAYDMDDQRFCGADREGRSIHFDLCRPSWCPIVPVPPHGRLIDADEYRAEMKTRQDDCAEWRDDIKNDGGYGTELYYRADAFLGAMCEAKLTLDKMPTIIPAEEGE